MKQGLTLEGLYDEVMRQKNTKRDFLAPSQALIVVPQGDGHISLQIQDAMYPISEIAHQQIAEFTKIPKAYYERMRTEAPDLLARNIIEWFTRNAAPRMARTLDGNLRAFLSNSFRPLDNADLLEAALPPLLEMGVKVMSCDVTPTKLYLKVVDESIVRQLPTGVVLGRDHVHFDAVSPALVLSNSEVGLGSLAVQTSVWTGGCTNLMVINERSTRKYHVGARAELGEDVFKLLTDQTRRLTDAALWAQVGDICKGAFERAQFDAICDKLEATTKEDIGGDPAAVVELTADKFQMSNEERSLVLKHLIKGSDLTRYGLHAAITRTAEDLESYDRASQFEVLGGKIIELPQNEWQELALAA